jgi:hypothetical protein
MGFSLYIKFTQIGKLCKRPKIDRDIEIEATSHLCKEATIPMPPQANLISAKGIEPLFCSMKLSLPTYA